MDICSSTSRLSHTSVCCTTAWTKVKLFRYWFVFSTASSIIEQLSRFFIAPPVQQRGEETHSAVWCKMLTRVTALSACACVKKQECVFAHSHTTFSLSFVLLGLINLHHDTLMKHQGCWANIGETLQVSLCLLSACVGRNCVTGITVCHVVT